MPTSGHVKAFMTRVIIVATLASELFEIAGSLNRSKYRPS